MAPGLDDDARYKLADRSSPTCHFAILSAHDAGWRGAQFRASNCTSGLVVEYIVAIDVTWV